MRTELKILRVKHHFTQSQVAERIGFSLSYYALVEQGKRAGSQKFWAKLKELYGVADSEMWKLMQLNE